MSQDKKQALFAMLIGFALGCAMIYVGGSGSAVLAPSVNMASLSNPMVQPSSMKFLQPSAVRSNAYQLRATPDREVALERRELLNAFVFAAAASAAQAASAETGINVYDDRKVREKGFDNIYEARDDALPQNTRNGNTQARASIENTKARIQESKKRITTMMPQLIKQAYWTQAKELVRLQVGTLRFDLNTLADTKAKSEKKIAKAANKAFLTDIEKLDFAIRKKDQAAAEKAYSETTASLDAALKNYA
jgi:photosystem II oxygen-evolving enhancer protein 3